MDLKHFFREQILPALLLGLVAEGFIGFAIYCVVTNKDISTFKVGMIFIGILLLYCIIKSFVTHKEKKNNDEDKDSRVNF